jgi:DNA modification methylase
LDIVWQECWRVLKFGGFICINIGDAVRTVGRRFRLYPNHARIISTMQKIGFDPLPDILWRKQTNAPNKFMGSGMLPAGAYVTYEHEYILIFRKGDKRTFSTPEEKADRRTGAYFWEERNVWFSDIWVDIKGTRQHLKDDVSRIRSAAFPFELAYRLICMYSIYGDTVLDPFLGTGTTTAAAIAGCRHSIGVEIDSGFSDIIRKTIKESVQIGENRIRRRLTDHKTFIDSKKWQSGHTFKHCNAAYQFEVMTSQEKNIVFFFPYRVAEHADGEFTAVYDDSSSALFV